MKKKWLVLIFLLVMFTGIGNVRAVIGYNGGNGGFPTGAGGGCNPSWSGRCLWNNKNFNVIKMTLIYYNGSYRETLGKPFYIMNKDYQYTIDTFFSNGIPYVINPLITDGCVGLNCSPSSGRISQYILNEANLNYILGQMGTTFVQLDRESEEGIGFNNKGYRIMIEPVIAAMEGGNLGYYTIKELYGNGQSSTNPSQDIGIGWWLHTDADDIGISRAGGQTGDAGLIGHPNSGYGYNIVNIGSFVKKCYRMVTNGSIAKCINTNKYNESNFSEGFKRVECSDKDQIENATADGRLIKTVNNNCKIYCKESVITRFPGNLMPAVTQGSYFVWPSFGSTKNEVHQLDIIGTRSCVMKGNSCGGYTATANDLYSNFESEAKIKYTDPDYKRDITLEIDKKRNTSNVVQNGSNIIVTRNVSLKIPDNIYRYVDKQTGKSVDTNHGNANRYTDIGFGNLPVSFKVPTGTKQNIQLFDIKLGVGNIFKTVANKEPYICNYETTNLGTECKCPPGTTESGKDLWCKLAGDNSSGMTCATAQSKYCDVPNGSNNPEEDDICPPDSPGPSKYCPEPNQHISVEACVTSGKSYQACVARYCNGNPPEYRCPDDTPNKGMLLTGCVEELISKGYGEQAAYNACKTINCPVKGINIIYRTINLDNPFPSKNLNGGIPGFNLTVIGRYPGQNWNSKDIVKTKILNNRGTSGKRLYDNKEPLYTIILNTSTMRAVRAYNRQHLHPAGYTDFTLSCLEADGSKCLSNSFLRGTTKLLTSGTCANATSKSAFDSCSK